MRQSGLVARFCQKLLASEPVLHCDLRQKQAAAYALLHQQTVLPDFDLLRLKAFQRRKDRNLDLQRRQIVGP